MIYLSNNIKFPPVFDMNGVGSGCQDDFLDDDRSVEVYVNKCSVDKGVNSGNVNRVLVAIEQIGERKARVVEAVRTNFAEAIITRPSFHCSFNNSFYFFQFYSEKKVQSAMQSVSLPQGTASSIIFVNWLANKTR